MKVEDDLDEDANEKEWRLGSLGAGLAPQGSNEGGVRGSAAPPIFSTGHLAQHLSTPTVSPMVRPTPE